MNPILSATLLNISLPLVYLNLIETINQNHLNNIFLLTQDKNCLFFKNPLTINNSNSNFHSDDLIIIKGSWKSIKCLFKSNQLSPFGRHLIIIILEFSLKLDPVTYVHFLWNKYRFRNVLLLWEYYYFSLDPFSGSISKWFYWDIKTAIEFLKKKLDLKYINFYGSNLRISIFDPTYRKLPTPITKEALIRLGVDGIALLEISHYYNATLLIATSAEEKQYGGLTKEGQLVGALGDIASLRADFAANARFVKKYETSQIELTTAIETDQLCVLVPTAGHIPSLEAILTSLPGYDWAAIGCLYVLTSGFLILTSRIRHSSLSLPDIATILFETSRPFLDGPLVRPPTETPERLIIISLYVCYGLFLTSFRTQLFDQLQGQRTYPQIDSLQELWTSGLRIQVSYANLADTFGTQGNDALKENLLERIIVTREAPQGNVAQLKRRNNYEQYSQDKNYNYHLISECPRTYALAYAVHQGSFLQPSLNIFLLRVLEFGIFKFWKQEEARIKNIKHFQSISINPSTREFTLHDMTLAFWMFAMGITLATCVFILEFVIYQLKNYFLSVSV